MGKVAIALLGHFENYCEIPKSSQILPPFRRQKAKKLSVSGRKRRVAGALPSAPGPHWGLCHRSHYKLMLHAHHPTP